MSGYDRQAITSKNINRLSEPSSAKAFVINRKQIALHEAGVEWKNMPGINPTQEEEEEIRAEFKEQGIPLSD